MNLLHTLFNAGTLDKLEKITQILAIFIGGGLAYIKFFKGRIYNPRLEPKVSGTAICKDGVSYLVAKYELNNVGTSKIEIQQKGSALRVSSYMAPTSVTKAQPLEWMHIGTYEIFEAHKWIESGENIEEKQLIAIPECDQLAFRLELCIVARKISWEAVEIIGWELETGNQEPETFL